MIMGKLPSIILVCYTSILLVVFCMKLIKRFSSKVSKTQTPYWWRLNVKFSKINFIKNFIQRAISLKLSFKFSRHNMSISQYFRDVFLFNDFGSIVNLSYNLKYIPYSKFPIFLSYFPVHKACSPSFDLRTDNIYALWFQLLINIF